MAKCPFAKWMGASPQDYSTQTITHQFIVEHIAQGDFQTGIDAWFHNPKAQVSAHFSISKLGIIHQYVDTDQMAYHCVDWNPKSIGIENLGYTGHHLTFFQKRSQKKLLQWIHNTCGTRLVYIVDPNDPKGGVIGHGKIPEGALSHPDCPGDPVLSDVIKILRGMAVPVPPPAPLPSSPSAADLAKAGLTPLATPASAALATKNGWALYGWNGTKFVPWKADLLSGHTKYANKDWAVRNPNPKGH